MRLGRSINAFLRAPAARRRLALEAGWELVRARIDTLRPARHYTARLGVLNASAVEADPAQIALAEEIGHVVMVAAKFMPFRAKCLQQVLACRRMLNRRGVPATVYLGLSEENGAPVGPEAVRSAHAWIASGGRIVNGDHELDRYVVVGAFS